MTPTETPMRKITAQLSIDLFVDCPFCDQWGIDVFKENGDAWEQVIHNFFDHNDKTCDVDIDCPKCKKTFKITEVEL